MLPKIQIRESSIEDAGLLAELGARTFRDAFGADNNPEDLNSYLAEAFSKNKMLEELNEPTSQFFIAFEASEPVGYTKLRAIKSPDCIPDPNPIELERIYVDQRCIGKGVGAALMKRSIEEGRDAGFKTIWLGVWKKNEKAVRFYEKWGYKIVGEHEFIVGKDVQYDHIMMHDLTLL